MNEWNIQSRSRACQACGRAFAHQQTYHTLLFDERQDYRRLDVCAACWAAQYSQGARERKGFISYWQGVYEAPPPRPEPLPKDTAETLLRKLVERNDPRYGPAAYILAVMLERKRALRVREQFEQDGRRVHVYEQRATGDVFTIPDPRLRLDQLEAVQRDVAELLQHGLPPPAPAAPCGAEPGAVAGPLPPGADGDRGQAPMSGLIGCAVGGGAEPVGRAGATVTA